MLLPAAAVCPSANGEVFVSRYAVNLAGLRIGDAIVHMDLGTKRYKMAVSADVGVLLSNTKIQAEASGSRSGAKLMPELFQLVMSGSEQGAVEVHFPGAPATGPKAASKQPAKQPNNPVPSAQDRLRGVLDPLSALLVTSLKPSSSSPNPCNAVLPVFTGRARFDINIRAKASNGAPDGPAIVTCEVLNVSTGANQRSGQNDGGGARNVMMEIGFRKLAAPAFWLVENLSLETPNGTVTIVHAGTSISGS